MFYKISRVLLTTYCYIFLGYRKADSSTVPKSGGVIICANHSSFWDPPIIGIGLPRKLTFMAKDSLFEFKPFAWLIKSLGAFPVNRDGGDLAAVRAAIDVVKSGRALLIFPQGTRCKMDNPVPAKQGAIKIAQITGAPIIPVGLNEKFKLFSGTRIKIGEPIYYKRDKSLTDEDMERMSNELMDRIYELARDAK